MAEFHLFAILTRLQDEKEGKLDLRDKAKLYDGRSLPGWTEDSVKELRDKYPSEGMSSGVSARYIQDKISNCLGGGTSSMPLRTPKRDTNPSVPRFIPGHICFSCFLCILRSSNIPHS